MSRTASRAAGAWAAAGLGVLLTASCAVFPPASAEVLARLPAPPTHAHERRTATVQVDAPQLSGVYRAVRIVSLGPAPSVRLQLLPDLGGKVLDLVATPERIRGYSPGAGVAVDLDRTAPGPLPRNALVFLAASLLEDAAPLAPERVRGARRIDGGFELLVEPVLRGTRVCVRIDDAGEVFERRYYARGARWTERITPGHVPAVVLEGGGGSFRMSFEDARSEELESVPAAIYELGLSAPAGGSAR